MTEVPCRFFLHGAAGAYGAVVAEPAAWCIAGGGQAVLHPRAEAGMAHPILVPGESSLGPAECCGAMGEAGAAPPATGKDARAGGRGMLQLLWGVPGQHSPGLWWAGWRGPMQSGWCRYRVRWDRILDAQGDEGCSGHCRDARGSARCPGWNRTSGAVWGSPHGRGQLPGRCGVPQGVQVSRSERWGPAGQCGCRAQGTAPGAAGDTGGACAVSAGTQRARYRTARCPAGATPARCSTRGGADAGTCGPGPGQRNGPDQCGTGTGRRCRRRRQRRGAAVRPLPRPPPPCTRRALPVWGRAGRSGARGAEQPLPPPAWPSRATAPDGECAPPRPARGGSRRRGRATGRAGGTARAPRGWGRPPRR